MSNDEIQQAYQRISGRFPAEWPVVILASAHVGRRKSFDVKLVNRQWVPDMETIDSLDFSLHVTAGGVDYVEIDVDLDEIESAANAIIEQIAAADMADPVRSRRGLDRLAEAVAVTPPIEESLARIAVNAVDRMYAAIAPMASGTGRAA